MLQTLNPRSDHFFLTALAKQANDVIIATRADRIDAPDGPEIVYCNPAFEQMTGRRRDEVMGQTPPILQTPDTDRAELDRVRAALIAWNAGDETAEAHVEVENQRRNGERYGVDLQIVPVWAPDYAPSYWISIQRDVTARRMRAGGGRDHDAGAPRRRPHYLTCVYSIRKLRAYMRFMRHCTDRTVERPVATATRATLAVARR